MSISSKEFDEIENQFYDNVKKAKKLDPHCQEYDDILQANNELLMKIRS